MIETSLPSNLLKDISPFALIKIEDLSQKKGFLQIINSIRNNPKNWEKLQNDPTYINLDFWDFIDMNELEINYE